DPFFDYLYISLNNKKDMNIIGDSIINFLKIKNNITKDIYKVENFLRSEDKINEINNLIIKIIRIIGYIFIVISGINITNVMLFSVNNRVNEIGLRKISGANKYDIFIQFITESSILSLVGGIIGVFLGSMVTFFLGRIINENLNINFINLFRFLIISLITGVIFGLFPAIKACNINLADIFNNE
ncbi:ABC transporter permease protein, partial [Candidatus Arthromitus sp. SFB-1]